MKKMIARITDRADEVLMDFGDITLSWKWYHWALWYALCFFGGYGAVGIVIYIITKIKG